MGFCSFVVCLVISLSFVEDTSAERFTHDIRTRYFTDVNLICDHWGLNITQRKDIMSLAWIFPDGSLVTKQTNLDPRQYRLQGLPDTINPESPAEYYAGYNLTVFEVEDNNFGYYTCIVMLRGSNQRLAAIRYGLNIDGADFSELLEEYERNAMVGGIAAAVVLVIIAGCWLVWYRCCNLKLPVDDAEECEQDSEHAQIEMKDVLPPTDKGNSYYCNEAFAKEKLESENETNISNEPGQSYSNSRL